MIAESNVVIDGQLYKKGDEIWDLGSFVATDAVGNVRHYEGLSADISKLPHYVDTGSSARCLDTGDYYRYLKSTDKWYLKESGSGGTGGTSNYNELKNKPQINGVELDGNVSGDSLGLIQKEQSADHAGEVLTVGEDGIIVPKELPKNIVFVSKAEMPEEGEKSILYVTEEGIYLWADNSFIDLRSPKWEDFK